MTGFEIKQCLSKNIKRLRKDKKLSQERLADLAGISTEAVVGIENCRRWPREDTLAQIAQALSADIYSLFLPDAYDFEIRKAVNSKIMLLKARMDILFHEIAQ